METTQTDVKRPTAARDWKCHMYLRDLADSLLRRWILVVLAVMMTAGMCFLAARSIAPTYKAEASMVLVPPKSVVEPTANRFLGLSSLTQAVDVLTRLLNADETQELVHKTAAAGTYEATVDDATSAPVLVVTAEAPTAAAAGALVDAVLKQTPSSLAALQSKLSIAPKAAITSIPLTRDAPKADQKSRLRAIAALGVMGLAGGAVLIGALDGLLLVRASKKELRRRRNDGAPPTAAREDDDNWLENELATISSGVLDAGPLTKKTKKTRPRDPGEPSSRNRE